MRKRQTDKDQDGKRGERAREGWYVKDKQLGWINRQR